MWSYWVRAGRVKQIDKIKFSDTLLTILGTEHLAGAEVEELPHDARPFEHTHFCFLLRGFS